VAEFLEQHSSPGERACREVVALKAQNDAFASQIGALKAEVADLTAQSSRAIALLLAVAVKSFGVEQFLAETIKVGLETNADQLGEMISTFYLEMTWNQELDAVRKYAPESPLDEAITLVQKRFPQSRVGRFPPSVKKGKATDWQGREVEIEIEIPDGIIAHLTRECRGNVHDRRQSGHLGELFAVVGLRGGSRVTGGLSARGLANGPVGDWSDHFTFIVGDRHYRCPSSVAQFLSPRVSKLHSIDATISELRLEVEDRDKLFGLVLEAAKGNSIAADSDHRGTFEGTCAALWNSELCEFVCDQQRDDFTMDNVLDRLRFRSANRSDISAELEFFVSHFRNFLPHHPQTLTTLSFSFLCEIIGHESLRIENEDSLYDFIRRGAKINPEMFCLLEFVKFEYCSTDVVDAFFDLLWETSYEINASMWVTLRTRLVLPNINIDNRQAKQFPPLVKKGRSRWGREYDVP
jgi:hypothetical protein